MKDYVKKFLDVYNANGPLLALEDGEALVEEIQRDIRELGIQRDAIESHCRHIQERHSGIGRNKGGGERRQRAARRGSWPDSVKDEVLGLHMQDISATRIAKMMEDEEGEGPSRGTIVRWIQAEYERTKASVGAGDEDIKEE